MSNTRRIISAFSTIPEGIAGTGTVTTDGADNTRLVVTGGDYTQFDKYTVNQYRNVWIVAAGSKKKALVKGVLRTSPGRTTPPIIAADNTAFTVYADRNMTGIAGESFIIVVADLKQITIEDIGGNGTVDGVAIGTAPVEYLIEDSDGFDALMAEGTSVTVTEIK